MTNEKQTGGAAFPCMNLSNKAKGEQGMTLRQYAAIELKVPDSGTDWLDEMIRKSKREEFAAKAMEGMASNVPRYLQDSEWKRDVSKESYKIADEMMKAGEL